VKLAYMPGCMLEGSARECDAATRAVFAALGVELTDVPAWRCCGATTMRSLDPETWIELNTANLQRAASVGDELMLACAICLRNLNEVKRILKEQGNPAGGPNLLSVAEVLARPEIIGAVRQKVEDGLEGLPVAAYYGCQLLRKGTQDILRRPRSPLLHRARPLRRPGGRRPRHRHHLPPVSLQPRYAPG